MKKKTIYVFLLVIIFTSSIFWAVGQYTTVWFRIFHLHADANEPGWIENNFGYCRPPLLRAAISNRIDIAELLLERGANIEASSGYWPNKTPIVFAAENNNIEMVNLFIERGANVNAHKDNGRDALFYAVANNNRTLAILLIQNGANIDNRDRTFNQNLGDLLGDRINDSISDG